MASEPVQPEFASHQVVTAEVPSAERTLTLRHDDCFALFNEIGDIERGVESGTDDFLTKPVKKLELITRVKSLLRVRHLKRELDRTLAYLEQVEQGGEDQPQE